MLNALRQTLSLLIISFCTIGILIYSSDMSMPCLALIAVMLGHLATESFVTNLYLRNVTKELRKTTDELNDIKTKVENSCWY